MKQVLKKKLLFIAIFTAALAGFTACDDETADETPSGETVQPNNTDLPSIVADGETLILSEDFNFNLASALRVEEGGILVIEPGVTITATEGSAVSKFIVVEQGGKIMAEGTAQKPVVMTAATKTPGAWGGLLIAGKAPINTAGAGGTTVTEIGDAVYGGDVANDNSGVLKYVRVEYTGSEINADKQHNGITFYGVGNGTVVDYIQAYKGKDDGIEFFGGTVNVNHVVVIGSQDDQFDFAEGWTGTAENVYLMQVDDASYFQDKGVEADNLGSNNAATPFSDPTIRNLTIIGFPSVKNEDGETVDGIRIREGAKGNFENVVIEGYGDDGIDARSLVTLQNLNSGDLVFTNVFVSGLGDKAVDAKIDDGETDPGTVAADAKAKLTTAIVTTKPAGANFDAWKGPWVRMQD